MVPIFEKIITATFVGGETSGASLQSQLHSGIRGLILTGELKADTRLPSTRALAKQQGVSRNTVLAAYDQLIAEGYLETRTGAGTFVSPYLPEDFMQPEPKFDTPTPTKEKPIRRVRSGLPAIDAFPKDIWARVNSRVWRRATTSMLSQSNSMGYLPLRQAICAYLSSSRNVKADADQIIILSGLQQGMKLIADSIMAPKEHVILEDPGYDGLLRTALACQTKTAFTSIDENGAVVPPDSMGRSLLVVCPSHQHPLGVTMPTSRRLDLIKWARRTNSYILEDDYDSEFRYQGRPLNSLQGISGGEHVIYGGSFSKVTFPALRIGYLVLPRHLVGAVRDLREATDSFPSIMTQLALTEFIEEGHFARHLRRLRKIHAERQAHFIACFQRHLASYFNLQPSSAGLDLVAWPTKTLLAAGFKKDLLWANLAQKAGLAAMPVSTAFRLSPVQQAMLLGFANFTKDQSTAATEKLARIMLTETGFK